MDQNLAQKVLTLSTFPIFYYPATWSTIHNRTHCSPPQSNKDKKAWWRKKASPQQDYQLTSQSSNDSVESL